MTRDNCIIIIDVMMKIIYTLCCYLFGHKFRKTSKPCVGFRCRRCNYFESWGTYKILIESPFAGDIERNIKYARRAMRHSFQRGEVPWCSHLIYTQDGILDDSIPEERMQGIEAGLIWGEGADFTVVYIDYGISKGMQYGIDRAHKEKRLVIYREIGKNDS